MLAQESCKALVLLTGLPPLDVPASSASAKSGAANPDDLLEVSLVSNTEADPSQEDGQKITIDDYRAAMDRAAKAEKQATQATRENAMLMAGIPTGTKVGGAFARDYDGKLDDPDAIRNAAVEWGLWKPEGSDASTDKVTPADQAQIDADRQLLQQGGLNPDLSQAPPAEHPGKVGLRRFDEELAAGKRRSDAFPELFDRLVDAANKGDSQVLVQGPER